MRPYLEMIYSLIYAADQMGLSSLVEFKALMRALNDPLALEKYVHKDIKSALAPNPTPEELNIYFCEMSDRNEIPLEEINIPGHKFTKDPKGFPSVPPSVPPSNFDDLEKKLGEDLNNKFKQGGGGGGFGGFGGNNMGGGGGINFNPHQQMDPKGFFSNPNNPPSSNGPNNQFIGGGFQPGGASTPAQNNPGYYAPNFYVPPDVPSKDKAPVKQSITSINDIDYYPEMDANPALFNKGTFKDPDFDQICERLRKGL